MGSQGPQHHADMEAQRREFEAWLHTENEKLTGILNSQRSLSGEELRIRQNTLKVGGVCYIFFAFSLSVFDQSFMWSAKYQKVLE